MGIKEKALRFAIEVHFGKFRKDEPDIPAIVHPLRAGKILESLGYDDNVVAAAYLHDVIEDSDYKITIEDIRKKFGNDIAYLVKTATEPNPKADWVIRKQGTIDRTKNLPARNKAVICADKISNVEDLIISSAKNGEINFKNFKGTKEDYAWYHYGIYESLKLNEGETPLYKMYKERCDQLFKSEIIETDFRIKVFGDFPVDFKKFRNLDGQRSEIYKLNQLVPLNRPYIIEFTGTPFTGKRTFIRNIGEYYNNSQFRILSVPSLKSSLEFIEKSKLSRKNPDILLVKETIKSFKKISKMDYDIILIEKSLFNSLVLVNQLYLKQDISEDYFQDLMGQLLELINKYIDLVIITYSDPISSLRRKYREMSAISSKDLIIKDKEDTYNKSLSQMMLLLKDINYFDLSDIESNLGVQQKIIIQVLEDQQDIQYGIKKGISQQDIQCAMIEDINHRLRLKYITRLEQL